MIDIDLSLTLVLLLFHVTIGAQIRKNLGMTYVMAIKDVSGGAYRA